MYIYTHKHLSSIYHQFFTTGLLLPDPHDWVFFGLIFKNGHMFFLRSPLSGAHLRRTSKSQTTFSCWRGKIIKPCLIRRPTHAVCIHTHTYCLSIYNITITVYSITMPVCVCNIYDINIYIAGLCAC